MPKYRLLRLLVLAIILLLIKPFWKLYDSLVFHSFFPMNRCFALIFRKLWFICSMPTVYITWPYANAELHKKRKAKKAGFTSHKHQSISAGDHLVVRCNLYVLFSLLKYIWKQIQVRDAVRRRLTFFLTARHLVFWKPCRWWYACQLVDILELQLGEFVHYNTSPWHFPINIKCWEKVSVTIYLNILWGLTQCVRTWIFSTCQKHRHFTRCPSSTIKLQLYLQPKVML